MVVGINHFSLSFFQILGVFQESGVMFEDVQKFEDLLMQQREFFAEEEIKYSFPRLMEFVIRVSWVVEWDRVVVEDVAIYTLSMMMMIVNTYTGLHSITISTLADGAGNEWKQRED